MISKIQVRDSFISDKNERHIKRPNAKEIGVNGEIPCVRRLMQPELLNLYLQLSQHQEHSTSFLFDFRQYLNEQVLEKWRVMFSCDWNSMTLVTNS